MFRSLFTVAAILPLAACSADSAVPVGTAAIGRFHAMLNAGQFDAIYDASSSEMKAAANRDKLDKLLEAVHRKLGIFKAGTAQGWNNNYTTNGHFVAISYASNYQKGTAVEAFTFRVDAKNAALVGYNINSDALILN